jgi:hypothetical protein
MVYRKIKGWILNWLRRKSMEHSIEMLSWAQERTQHHIEMGNYYSKLTRMYRKEVMQDGISKP